MLARSERVLRQVKYEQAIVESQVASSFYEMMGDNHTHGALFSPASSVLLTLGSEPGCITALDKGGVPSDLHVPAVCKVRNTRPCEVSLVWHIDRPDYKRECDRLI